MARSCAICGKESMGGFNPQSSGMNRVRAHRRMQAEPPAARHRRRRARPTKALVCTRCRRTQLEVGQVGRRRPRRGGRFVMSGTVDRLTGRRPTAGFVVVSLEPARGRRSVVAEVGSSPDRMTSMPAATASCVPLVEVAIGAESTLQRQTSERRLSLDDLGTGDHLGVDDAERFEAGDQFLGSASITGLERSEPGRLGWRLRLGGVSSARPVASGAQPAQQPASPACSRACVGASRLACSIRSASGDSTGPASRADSIASRAAPSDG